MTSGLARTHACYSHVTALNLLRKGSSVWSALHRHFGLFHPRQQNPTEIMDAAPPPPIVAPKQEFPWTQVQQVDYQNANTGKIVQACHAMIYARTSAKFMSQLPCKAWVLMQMRFDGKLGFPGGIVSDLEIPDETLEDGLNREMQEEMGLDLGKFAFRKAHYIVSHHCQRANLILNFYAQEVTEAQFKEIEMAALNSDEYGHECLGIIRIPLYTMADGVNGLPAFFQNQFAGSSLLQVVIGLMTQNIINQEDLKNYASVLPRHQAYRKLLDQAVRAYMERGPFPPGKVAQTVAQENKKVS